MTDNKLQVIPLGGLGEFGMNMMALRYGDDIIVIDSGMMFPEEELLGRRPGDAGPDLPEREPAAGPRPASHPRARGPHRRRAAISSPKSTCRSTAPPSRWRWWSAAWKSTISKKSRASSGEAEADSGNRAVQDRIHPRHALHDQCVALAITTPVGSHHPHRRFQSRSHAHRQRAVRPAHAGRLRQARRAAAALRLHQFRPARATPNPSAPCARAWKTSSTAPRSGWWFPASARRSTASS